MRIGFDATSLTAAGKGIARFQREFLHASAVHGLVEQLDVFVPEQPDEEALPQVEGGDTTAYGPGRWSSGSSSASPRSRAGSAWTS